MVGKGGCIYPGCKEPMLARGLCASCYQQALKAIHAKLTTWEKLTADGKALSPSKHRRKANSKFAYFAGQE